MAVEVWCDFRVMEERAYFVVYCSLWGIPLNDGGSIPLPDLAVEGRELEIILTGREVTDEDSLRNALCAYGWKRENPRES